MNPTKKKISKLKSNKEIPKIFIVSINNMAIQPYSNLSAAYKHFQSIVLSGSTDCLSYSAVNRRLMKSASYKFMAPNNIQYSLTVFDLLISFTVIS